MLLITFKPQSRYGKDEDGRQGCILVMEGSGLMTLSQVATEILVSSVEVFKEM